MLIVTIFSDPSELKLLISSLKMIQMNTNNELIDLQMEVITKLLPLQKLYHEVIGTLEYLMTIPMLEQ